LDSSSPSIIPGQQTFDFVALMRVVKEYKWSVSIVTLVFAIGGVVYALRATPLYKAEIGITEVAPSGIGAAGALASQLGGLAGLVGVNLSSMGGASKEYQAFLKSRFAIQEFISRHTMSELFPTESKPPTLWFAVRRFQQGVLAIRDDKRAGITIVSVTFTNPATAAKWANEFVAMVNELLRARAMDEAKRGIAYLNDQVAKTSTVELQKAIYNLIENETKTLMLANVRAEYAFTVVDPAVAPEVRVSPQRIIIVLGSALVGLLIGTSVAFVRNAWSSKRLSDV
jgi:uncharacterized protein involved in exopolysaccharide biosynthesis